MTTVAPELMCCDCLQHTLYLCNDCSEPLCGGCANAKAQCSDCKRVAEQGGIAKNEPENAQQLELQLLHERGEFYA